MKPQPSVLERLFNSRTGLQMAVSLARTVPPKGGYRIADGVAHWIASRRTSGPVTAVRTNQWVIAGRPQVTDLDSQNNLEQAVKAVFRNSARSIYDLYHYGQDIQAAGELFELDPSFEPLVHRPEFDGRGLIVAGLHMSGFDLALQWACSKFWIKALGLTLPTAEGARQLEFEIRKNTGINLVPATMNGLRQAIRHLKEGGMVATGVDRPVIDCQLKPLFFGQRAYLPVHHIYLAIKANVPVVVVVSRKQKNGKYRLFASHSIEMQDESNQNQTLLCNAEKVLAVAENFIRETPHQWSITLPVWPELVDHI